jgi:hypothetical protein
MTPTGKKTFNTVVEIRAETGDGVVRSNLWENSMSDKELNTLNTPRELTAEELELVVGGVIYMYLGAGAGKASGYPEDGNNQDGNNQGTTSVNREQSAPSISEISFA